MGLHKRFQTLSQIFPQILVVVSIFFHEFFIEDQKKRSLSQKFYETQCESTKTTKKQYLLANSKAINTNLVVLGLDLHSSSPERVNFFGAQSSFGKGHHFRLGGTSIHLGSTAPECPPPRGAGPRQHESQRICSGVANQQNFFNLQRSLRGVVLQSPWVRKAFAINLTETALGLP